MEKYLREWRQEALNRHQYDTAIFVADKLLAITDDDQDAFWLAQVHFTTGNYSRTQSLLARGNLLERTPQCRYLAAHCSIKLGKYDEALQMLGDKNPIHLISAPGSERGKMRHVDVNTRAGARHNKNGTRTDRVPTSEERDREDVNNIKSEAGMCYLRGVCYAKQNSFDRAKECYKIAVQIDVQCFEAFDALMSNSLMSPEQEWKFLETLNFDTINVSNNASLSQEAASFTKNLYTTRLSKYSRPDEFANATETLSTHYNLGENADIIQSRADLLYHLCRFREALELTNSVIAKDKFNFKIMPIHIACLHVLGEKNTLYLLSHELSESHPQEACSWLAIGTFYLCTKQIAEARRFFSKASMMDPHFGSAWIGFAHTFAAEGEHDQAISAYSTATRLFQGTHLPLLYLGMQNLQLGNVTLAKDYLKSAYDICEIDPLLLNELGIAYYQEFNYVDAALFLRKAIEISEQNGASIESYLSCRINLGHSLRRGNQFNEALETYNAVLRHTKDCATLVAKGLTLMILDRTWEAVTVLHEALAMSPQDPMATDLLNRALEMNESDYDDGSFLDSVIGAGNMQIEDADDMEQLERRMHGRLREIESNRVAGRKSRRRRHAQGEYGIEESMHVDEDEE